jgi:hypothetical protein
MIATERARRAERPMSTVLHRLDSGQLLLICAAGLVAVVGVAHTATVGLDRPEIAVGFGALIAVGELARLTMPGNREVAPIGAAAALGYTLLLDLSQNPLRHSALQVVAVIAAGMLAGALPHLAVGRPPRLDAMARRLLTGALLAFAFRPLADPLYAMTKEPTSTWWPALAVMVTLIAATLLIDVLIAAALRAEQVRTAFRVAVRDEINMAFPLGAAVASSRCWCSRRRCWSPRSPSGNTPASAPPICRPYAPCPGSPRSAATSSPATRAG